MDINTKNPSHKENNMKILFVASEAMPFVRSGGLGDVAGSLPKAFNALGHDCRVIIPFYKEEIDEKFSDTFRFLSSTFVDLSWRRQYCGVYEAVYDGVTYYFIDNEYYFKRKGLYGHFDDGERFAFFSKAVLEVLPSSTFSPTFCTQTTGTPRFVPSSLTCFIVQAKSIRTSRRCSLFTISNFRANTVTVS